MFSLLYYLHILPRPYPFVKHYFQNFLIYSNGAGAPIHRTNFPLVLRISYIINGHNYSIGPTMVPGAAVKADRTSTSIPWSLASSTLRSWRTWAPFSMSRSILP